jgi:hypothetical protein
MSSDLYTDNTETTPTGPGHDNTAAQNQHYDVSGSQSRTGYETSDQTDRNYDKYQESAAETQARIADEDQLPTPQESRAATWGDNPDYYDETSLAAEYDGDSSALLAREDQLPTPQESRAATWGDNPDYYDETSLAAGYGSDPGLGETGDPPPDPGISQEPAESQDKTSEPAAYETPPGTDSSDSYQETSRTSSNPDAVTTGPEQPAPPEDTPSSPALIADNISADADTASTDSQHAADVSPAADPDHDDQDAQPGQADSAGPLDPPDPPGSDNHADMTPEARIAELQAQLEQTKGELAQTRDERDQATAERDQAALERDQARAERDQAKDALSQTQAERDQVKAELGQANQEIEALHTRNQEQPGRSEDPGRPPDGSPDATNGSQLDRSADQPPTSAGKDAADATEPEQQTEDGARDQAAKLGEREPSDQVSDSDDAKTGKARLRHVVSPDNIAIGAALIDAQDVVQKVVTHAMHDSVTPLAAVATGLFGVAVSKVQERRKGK